MFKVIIGITGLVIGGWAGFYLVAFGSAALGVDGWGPAFYGGFIGAPVGALIGCVYGIRFGGKKKEQLGELAIPFAILCVVFLLVWCLMELFGGW